MSEPPDGKATFYPASSGSGSGPSGTEAETGRLPSDLSAERALVGGLLLSNDQLDQFTDFLRPEHFYETLHGRIYREIVDMYSGGRTADLISINPRMEGDEGYNEMGGLEYLGRLVDEVPAIYHLTEYAKIVFECASLRGLIEMSEGIRSRALGPRGDMSADQQVEEAEKMLFELARSGRPGKGHKSFKDSILEMLETAATAYKREGGLAGYSTGISDLDKHLGGLQRSDLVIVAGRPGMGKTAMATTLAYNIAKAHLNCQKTDKNGRKIDGAKVLYFSLEMSSEQLATRIISSVTGISSSRIRRGEIDQEEFSSLAQAAKEVEKTPLFIDDTGGISIAALAARARRLTLKEDIGVIMVDYLQLVTPSGTKRGDNRVQEISEITQTLKALAKELDVPIIALSQLSRAVESREDKRPMLSDLRESGSIEQDADIVMFLYRASYYLEQQKPPQGDEDAMRDWQEKRARLGYESEVIIGKHRHGPVGKADLYFDPKYTRFTNLQKADINGPVGEYGPH